VRILLAGTPAMVLPLFDEILSKEFEVSGVITNPPKARGRSSALTPSPVAIWAKENGLPVFDSGKIEDYESELRDCDLVLIVAYGQLIPEKYLNLPKFGWVNLHFSHLPDARGAAPVQRLIAAGAKEIGFTLFKLEKGMDTGPIYFHSPSLSIENLTTGKVWDLLIDQARKFICEELLKISSGHRPRPQSEFSSQGKVLIAPKISTVESRIDWHKSSKDIVQEILAFNPAPTAWSTFRGERILIYEAGLYSGSTGASGAPEIAGSISIISNSVVVRTGSGALKITAIQPAGKRVMTGEDWARGITLHEGEKFV